MPVTRRVSNSPIMRHHRANLVIYVNEDGTIDVTKNKFESPKDNISIQELLRLLAKIQNDEMNSVLNDIADRFDNLKLFM